VIGFSSPVIALGKKDVLSFAGGEDLGYFNGRSIPQKREVAGSIPAVGVC
jgi:hypothetical protein